MCFPKLLLFGEMSFSISVLHERKLGSLTAAQFKGDLIHLLLLHLAAFAVRLRQPICECNKVAAKINFSERQKS